MVNRIIFSYPAYDMLLIVPCVALLYFKTSVDSRPSTVDIFSERTRVRRN